MRNVRVELAIIEIIVNILSILAVKIVDGLQWFSFRYVHFTLGRCVIFNVRICDVCTHMRG